MREIAEVTDVRTFGLSKNTSVSSNREVVPHMDPNFYKAAVNGDISAFEGKEDEIESILTANRNTILHIHLTAYTDGVSEKFVEEILHMCPTLVEKVNVKGETILHIAARYGHYDMVSILIKRDRNLIRVVNDNNDTPLHEAVRYHHTKIVDILTMEDPAPLYISNSDGETPLYIAVEREYLDAVHTILNNCNSLNYQYGPNGRTPLHAAVLRRNKEMVSMLLLKSSPTIQADELGWVPLHLAALHQSPDLAEELLKYDRNMGYMRDNRGRTALHFAASCGNKDTMEKIIEYCPDCSELVDENGYNALHYSVIRGVSAADATEMILNNASLSNLYNEKDKNGNTPLHYIARLRKGYHYLLKDHERVDPMAFNKQNQTVIDIAYDEVRGASVSVSELQPYFLLEKMRKIGARYGGRVINKDDRKKKQEKIRDSTVDRQKKEEKKDGLDSIDRLREINLLVATLIAIITFAAGFTLPGGNVLEDDQPNKGSPILENAAAFQAFVITDTISLVLSASAVLLQIYLSIPRVRKEFSIYVHYMELSLRLTMLAMVFMMIAFVTGIYAVLSASKSRFHFVILIGLSFFYIFYLAFFMARKLETTSIKKEQLYSSNKPDGNILEAEEIQLSESNWI